MVRVVTLYLIYSLFYPWQWFLDSYGESPINNAQVEIIWAISNVVLSSLYVVYYTHRAYGRCGVVRYEAATTTDIDQP